MSSSGSSSGSSKAKRKKDKSKKDKKSKKAKKAKKDDKKGKKAKKDDKRIEATKEWFCDRLDAVKYTRQLLEIDSNVATELEVLFESLDEGEVVRIDGLENMQVKKKLRHLLKALKLTPEGENGFKSADRKVSFTTLFSETLRRAKEKNAAEAAAVVVIAPESPPQVQQNLPAVAADSRAAAATECGEDSGLLEEAPPPPKPKRPRMKGPQLPMPGIGAVEDSEGEGSSDGDDQGPKLQGAERVGVDLNSLQVGRQRESWMTEAHGSLGGMFADAPAAARKGDSYQVKRSQAEVEAFEKMMKERGASLMEETKEGKFQRDDAKKHVDDLRKKMTAHEEQWGMSEKQQDRQKLAANAGASGGRKAFNPEEDLRVRKPISGADFTKFVEEAGGELAGRFSRGQVATSFL